jgi:hypothetical protein
VTSPGQLRRLPSIVWAEHRASILILIVYAVASYVWLAAHGRSWYPLSSFALFWPAWAIVSLVYMSVQFVLHPNGNPAAPPLAHRLATGITFGLIVAVLSGCFHSVKHSIGQVRGLPWDDTLSRADIWLHGGVAPAFWLLPLFSDGGLYWMDRIYGAWGLAALAYTAWLAWTVHPVRHRARLAWFALWIGVGNIAAWVLASGGPIAVDPRAGAGDYSPLLQRLQSVPDMLAPSLHAALLSTYHDDHFVPFIGISAMPSLHVGGVVLLALTGWARSRALGLLFWAYGAVILAGSVLLGWHYAIDGYVGGFAAWLAWTVAGGLYPASRSEPRP